MEFKVASIITAGIVVVVIWALAAALRQPPIKIVAVEIQIAGQPPPYYYQGFSLNEGQNFSYTFQYPFTYPSKATIASVYVSTVGFTLNSITPSLPYALAANSTVTFTVAMTAPEKTYNGPLTLTFGVYL